MFFWARALSILLLVCSMSTFLIFGYFQLRLSEISRIKTNKVSFAVSDRVPRVRFNWEKLWARFYLPSEESSPASSESIRIKAPELRAIYFGKETKLALLKFGKESYWVKEGDRIKGWRVAGIHPESVSLSFKDYQVVQKLFESGSGASERESFGRSPSGSSRRMLVISREELERLTADIGSLFSRIRLRPHFRRGQIIGVRVEYVDPRSLFFRAGLRAGDVILTINGIPVRKNEDAFRILETIKTASSLSVRVRRVDKILTLKAEVR